MPLSLNRRTATGGFAGQYPDRVCNPLGRQIATKASGQALRRNPPLSRALFLSASKPKQTNQHSSAAICQEIETAGESSRYEGLMNFIGDTVQETKGRRHQNDSPTLAFLPLLTESKKRCRRQHAVNREMGQLVDTRQRREVQTVALLMGKNKNGSHDQGHGNHP